MNIEIENNKVYRDQVMIGHIDGDNCYLLEKQPPAVKGAINKAADRKLTFSVGYTAQDSGLTVEKIRKAQAILEKAGVPSVEIPPATTETTTTTGLTDDELQAALSERGLCVATIDQPEAIPVPPVASKTVSPIQVLLRRAEMGQIPKPPETDAMLGQRTPEFVAWVKEHAAPEDFKKAYENRRLPSWEEHLAELARKTGRNLPGEDKPTQF